jgi:hypothetical protein
MSQIDRIRGSLEAPFHLISHHDSPDEVLDDAKLSAAEKRVILSSWASDMYAVESNPALRKVPNMAHSLRLSDILAALRKLDGEFDPPPRGGAAMRIWRPASIEAIARTHGAAGRSPPWRPSRVAAGLSR